MFCDSTINLNQKYLTCLGEPAMLIDQIESSETSFEKAVVCRNVWVFSLWV